MLKNIWCMIFHRRHTYVQSMAGDWKFMRCDKCQITWPMPRI